MAKVLSSISGNLISAASAGFAPTNSADVSAIASAYQVVSATGTQLYAGTAHVTSVNDAPISASRAGNAANASLATSAWYDGTGRFISALPDAAEVSAIASAYADDKLDKTAEVVTATAGDGTYVTSINGMGLSGQGGGGAQIVTATGSASATAFTGGFIIETSYLVSSINGSAILSYGYDTLSSNSAKWTSTNSAVSANSAKWTSTNSAVSANSAKWTSTNSAVSANSAKWTSTNNTVLTNSANWNSVYNTVSNNSASWSGSTGGGSVTSPSGTIFVMNGNAIEGTNSAVVTASGTGFEEPLYPQTQQIGRYMQLLTNDTVPDTGATLMIPLSTYAWTDIDVILSGMDTGYGYASASGIITSGALTANIPMDGIVSNISASANNWINLENYSLTAKKEGVITVTGIGELAWKSAVDNVTNTVSSNSATWGQGGVDSATVSSIASSYAESAVSSKLNTGAVGFSSVGDDPYVTGISGREIIARFAPLQSAVVSSIASSIASSYAQSAVSSKADSSALSSYVPYSSLEYNTASAISGINGSALAAGSTYSAGEGIDITDDVISVEAPVDIVAGPGIVIDNPDGNTLRVSTEADAETVLFADTTDIGISKIGEYTLSEAAEHFERIRIYFARGQSFYGDAVFEFNPNSGYDKMASLPCYDSNGTNMYTYFCSFTLSSSKFTELTGKCGYFQVINGTSAGSQVNKTSNWLHPYKIVGIHRIANN